MKWVPDRTGRFAQRPQYEQSELDAECEAVIAVFLQARHGRVSYPITTNDLTMLIEDRVGYLDLYADFSRDGGDVEGATDFIPGKQPNVRIIPELSQDPRRENRFRTTLTHEFGHVHFHTVLCGMGLSMLMPLFGEEPVTPVRCKRSGMLGTGTVDWMEWQAGYASGAFLMPYRRVCEIVRELHEATGTSGVVAERTPLGVDLITRLQEQFAVSADAARVRLLKLGYLTDNAPSRPLLT